MGLFAKNLGTVASFFQVGGPTAPGLNNVSSSVLSVTTSAGGTNYANVRGADPLANNDFVTLGYGNAHFGGTPGGSDTQVQFNSTGTFAGSANLTWDGTNLSTLAAQVGPASTDARTYQLITGADPLNGSVSALFLSANNSLGSGWRLYFNNPALTSPAYALNFTGVTSLESLPASLSFGAASPSAQGCNLGVNAGSGVGANFQFTGSAGSGGAPVSNAVTGDPIASSFTILASGYFKLTSGRILSIQNLGSTGGGASSAVEVASVDYAGNLSLAGSVSQLTTATALTLVGNAAATGTGVILDTGTTTITSGLSLRVNNNGTQCYAISGYGHPLYAFASHVPSFSNTTDPGITFVSGSTATAAGTTALAITVPSYAVGYTGILVCAVTSAAGTATVSGITGSTGTWFQVGSKANSTPTCVVTMWACNTVAASGTATCTISGTSTETTAAMAAYSGVSSVALAGVTTNSGTGTSYTVAMSSTVANSFIVAGLGSDGLNTPTASVGNLRAATNTGFTPGSCVALNDNTSATVATVTNTVTAWNAAFAAIAVELLPGGQSQGALGFVTNVSVTGSDAVFGLQFETGSTSAYTGGTSPTYSLFEVQLANPYSAATAGTWGATCVYVGTGSTPVAGGSPTGTSFYCIVTAAGHLKVYATSTFTPTSSTYYNFLFTTYGLSATY